jgi:hypothetical protein
VLCRFPSLTLNPLDFIRWHNIVFFSMKYWIALLSSPQKLRLCNLWSRHLKWHYCHKVKRINWEQSTCITKDQVWKKENVNFCWEVETRGRFQLQKTCAFVTSLLLVEYANNLNWETTSLSLFRKCRSYCQIWVLSINGKLDRTITKDSQILYFKWD